MYAEELNRRLKHHGIGRTELARAMNINPSQVSRWLNTTMVPTIANHHRIERAIRYIRQKRASQRWAE